MLEKTLSAMPKYIRYYTSTVVSIYTSNFFADAFFLKTEL